MRLGRETEAKGAKAEFLLSLRAGRTGRVVVFGYHWVGESIPDHLLSQAMWGECYFVVAVGIELLQGVGVPAACPDH